MASSSVLFIHVLCFAEMVPIANKFPQTNLVVGIVLLNIIFMKLKGLKPLQEALLKTKLKRVQGNNRAES